MDAAHLIYAQLLKDNCFWSFRDAADTHLLQLPHGNSVTAPENAIFRIESRVDEYIRLMDASEEVMNVDRENYNEYAINVDRYLHNAVDRQPISLESWSSEKVENLCSGELELLINKLRKYMRAIRHSLDDIPGISSDLCMHRIHLEDGSKSSIEHQRKLNPNLKEVGKTEILKLLDAGVIYLISDSNWVSPMHVLPKKGGITVVKNDKDELIPMRTVTDHRMCIDYRKLKAAPRKDNFPLPFIVQMLEWLAHHQYYCFLNGYFRFFQIPIHPDD